MGLGIGEVYFSVLQSFLGGAQENSKVQRRGRVQLGENLSMLRAYKTQPPLCLFYLSTSSMVEVRSLGSLLCMVRSRIGFEFCS